MKTVLLLVSVLNLLSFSPILAQSSSTLANNFDLAIENVSLFDSKTKQVHHNKTVLIKGDRIASIVDAKQGVTAAKVIKGNGKLLVPGFIDTHTHLGVMLNVADRVAGPEFLDDSYRKKLTEKFLEYGVTTVFDMAQPETWFATTIDWQKNPSPDYPNYFLTGSSMVSASERLPDVPHWVQIKDPEAGIQKVAAYKKQGIESIKLYSRLEADDMQAIVKAAQDRGMKMYAHTDFSIVTIQEAMEMGVRHFEHFFTLVPSVLNYDTHWPLMNEKFGLARARHMDEFSAGLTLFFQYVSENKSLDSALLKLFDEMAEKGASLSTALNVLGSAAEETYFFSSFEHFPLRNKPTLTYTPEQKALLKKAFATMMQYAKTAHEKGVMLRIGTDTREGGKALLGELLLFHKAGFKVEDILQIASWNGAKAMEIEDEYGSIEIGKKADLVLFDKNPFDDPQHFLSKKTVIKGGKEYRPKPKLISTIIELVDKEGAEAGLRKIKTEKANLEAYELVEIGYHILHTDKIEAGIKILEYTEEQFPDFKNIYYPAAFLQVGYDLLRSGNTKQGVYLINYSKIKFPDATQLNENELNRIGYELLTAEKNKQAVAVFELNVKSFPASFNAYDSYGEGLLSVGEKEKAVAMYQKSIALNPDNKNGKEVLAKIKKENSSSGDTPSEKDLITETLMDYIEGTANGDAERIRRAFHPDLNLYNIDSDSLKTTSGQRYISYFEDGKNRNRIGSIVAIDYVNDAASAKIKVIMPESKRIYTDYLLLLKIRGEWKIIHKSYTFVKDSE